MGFWIFMVCMNLIVPLTMVGFGAVFLRRPPRKINGAYGYRTARSMASQEAWDFAHGEGRKYGRSLGRHPERRGMRPDAIGHRSHGKGAEETVLRMPLEKRP